MSGKVSWQGVIVSVQPRIRLGRSFDEIYHTYLGYNLALRGTLEGEPADYSVGLGKAAYLKHQLEVGDEISGAAQPVADPRMETVDYYRVSKLRIWRRQEAPPLAPPPWHGVAPDMETYRERGHRRLATRTHDAHCTTCLWGCRMAVEMMVEPWPPHAYRYRTEAFCYGPKSCTRYAAGPLRRVPGRKGMVWEEPEWLDEEFTGHRGPDD